MELSLADEERVLAISPSERVDSKNTRICRPYIQNHVLIIVEWPPCFFLWPRGPLVTSLPALPALLSLLISACFHSEKRGSYSRRSMSFCLPSD